jgi:hypothetical protein
VFPDRPKMTDRDRARIEQAARTLALSARGEPRPHLVERVVVEFTVEFRDGTQERISASAFR